MKNEFLTDGQREILLKWYNDFFDAMGMQVQKRISEAEINQMFRLMEAESIIRFGNVNTLYGFLMGATFEKTFTEKI